MGKARASARRKKTIIKNVVRKKSVVTTKAKDINDAPPHRPSKFVGVNWEKKKKKWRAQIMRNGNTQYLGLFVDEKEAARVYDEQAILLGKPVNFPLHEGMEQAVKKAPHGSGPKRKSRAKSIEEG